MILYCWHHPQVTLITAELFTCIILYIIIAIVWDTHVKYICIMDTVLCMCGPWHRGVVTCGYVPYPVRLWPNWQRRCDEGHCHVHIWPLEESVALLVSNGHHSVPLPNRDVLTWLSRKHSQPLAWLTLYYHL